MNFTIIIPHKNIPSLLCRLISSIPVRDDLEIIVVDDGSDSELVNYEDLPFKDRANTHLILNKESRGAGYARNCALPLAKGKWVLFADSDDFFNEGFDAFLDDYVDSDAAIVFFNANSVDTNSFEPSNRVDHLHEFINDYEQDEKTGSLMLRYLFTEPWCKMVKRELIKKYAISFEETCIRNDVRYSYMVGHYSKNIIVDSRQLYCVTTRRGSVSRGVGYKASMDELKVFAGWKKFFIDNKIQLELPKFEFRAYNFTRNLYKRPKLFRQEYSILREAGFSRIYIIRLIIRYLYKSVGYKLS